MLGFSSKFQVTNNIFNLKKSCASCDFLNIPVSGASVLVHLAKEYKKWLFLLHAIYGMQLSYSLKFVSVGETVSTFFHPANRPIDFVKSFLFGFFY